MAWVLFSALWLAGCAGYQLGPTNGLPARSRSVQVNAFQNLTEEPRLTSAVAQALRKRLSQEATFRLATHNDGDVVVSGTITRYYRSPVSFQPADIIAVRDYDLFLTVKVVAEERATGNKLLEREVTGRASMRVGVDQGSAERMALPALAEDLAFNLSALLIDGTW